MIPSKINDIHPNKTHQQQMAGMTHYILTKEGAQIHDQIDVF